jgi:5'-nucleotidase
MKREKITQKTVKQGRMRGMYLVSLAGMVLLMIFAGEALAQNEASNSVKGLRVLLTNDDSIQGKKAMGHDGLGLYRLRSALCAAGADVIVIGPWGRQSGKGGAIATGGKLTIQEATPPEAFKSDCANSPSGGRVFGVCTAETCDKESPSGSPSDSVALALTRFIPENIWSEGPDVVLSGINFGPNPGLAVFHSGTVSAVVTAFEFGTAGIAFSEEVDLMCLDNPDFCPDFKDQADFAVKLLGALRAEGLVDEPKLLLNVNYPVIKKGETIGKPKLTVHGTGNLLATVYKGKVGAEGGSYDLDFVESTPESRQQADTTALIDNNISVAPMDGDWTASLSDATLDSIVKRVGAVVEQLAQ